MLSGEARRTQVKGDLRTLALRIREAQSADSTLRTAAAQQAVLNVELVDLQHALMQAWRLPSMLVRITTTIALPGTYLPR